MYEFKTLKELESFVRPVLKIRVKTLTQNNTKTTEDELFNYLKNRKWKNTRNLHLCDIVNDVLNENIDDMKVIDNETV